MTKAEYEAYLAQIPYDAMGDFSVFKEKRQEDLPSDQEKDPQQK